MRIALPLLAALALSACVTNSPPPVTKLAAVNCVEAPVTAAARELPFAAEEATRIALSETSPCITTPTGPAVYEAVRLPRLDAPYLVSIGSIVQGAALFSPRLTILGEDGQMLRQIPRESFNFRGAAFDATLRIAPGDRFLLITSDPDTVGKDMSQMVSSVSQSVVCAPWCVPIYRGNDSQRLSTFAHNGVVTLRARGYPVAK